jgi:hypothetical protein
MKKVAVLSLAILLVFIMSSGVFATAVSLKLGFEPSGTMDSVYSTTGGLSLSTRDTRPVPNSFSTGGEMTRRTVEGLVYGAGIEYQLYRKAEGSGNSFSFIPVYGLVRAEFPLSQKIRSFIFGRAGYNFYQEDNPTDGFALHGGLYYAAGAGLVLSKKVEMQMMYACNNGETYSSYVNVQHTYTNVSLGLGIRL